MIPKRLFRFFKERQHADEFIDGKIRIGKLSGYRYIEDARQDESEGTSYFIWNKPARECILDKTTGKIIGRGTSPTEKIKSDITLINPLYLLCTSSASVEKRVAAHKFGKYFIEITDPSGLIDLLKQLWARTSCSLNGYEVELKRVRYTRGNLVKPNRCLIAPGDISYTQKSLRNKDDYEYRFIFWCKIDANMILDDYQYLDIGSNNNVIKKKIQEIKEQEIKTAPQQKNQPDRE